MRNKVADGKIIDLLNGFADAVASGGIVVEGNLAGVATQTHAVGSRLPCDMEGVFDLPVTDTVGMGIAIGDPIRVTLATGALSNAAYGAGTVHFFGYALEAVAANETATIRVLKVMSHHVE